MNFKKIKNINSGEFKKVWEIYEYSFPEVEKRTLNEQKKVMKNKNYSFFAVYNGDNLVGFIAVWAFEDLRLFEHLAIREDLRCRGLGTQLIKEFISENNGKVVVELEKPETEMARRRIEWYKRMKFHLNEHNYIQPAYSRDKKPLQMILTSYPKEIDEKEFIEIRKALHCKVYNLKKPLVNYG